MAVWPATATSLLVAVLSCCQAALAIRTYRGGGGGGGYISAVGDPGMRRDGLRVAWEAWNFCNEVGQEAPGMGSPRGADCFDLEASVDEHGQPEYVVVHRVTDADNSLGAGDPFPGAPANATVTDVDRYAAAKELYLGDRCQVPDSPEPWQFWMVMLKNGNLDTTAAICPENGRPARPFPQTSRFPCPGGAGCMNQPLVFHNRTTLDDSGRCLRGGLFGTYELDAVDELGSGDVSHYSVTWEKEVAGAGRWAFHHKLRTSKKYPWLMLYLRSDATRGFSGGYHYDTRGMTKIVPESPDFKVRVTLEVKKGGGPNSQFYLMDMGSCWKNDGRPCDGDTVTDVTRYSEMIINPETPAWCRRGSTSARRGTRSGTAPACTAPTRPASPTARTTSTAPPGTRGALSSPPPTATPTATRSRRRYCSSCRTRCGASSATPRPRGRAGSGTQGPGSSTSAPCPRRSTSTRIPARSRPGGGGRRWTWARRFTSATRPRPSGR